MAPDVDVLIVGAGPVGLMLATLLRRDGLSVKLIEARAERTFFSKALGITARTLEIFEDLGVADDAVDAGFWLTGVTTFDNGSQTNAATFPSSGLPYGPLSLPQDEVEALLERCLRRHGGDVRYDTSLIGFGQDAESVTARVRVAQGAEEAIRARWLVGTDGARSTVRKSLGLDFAGGQIPATFVLGDVDIDWDLPRGPMYRFNRRTETGESNTVVAVPIAGNPKRYRIATMTAGTGDTPSLGAETAAPSLDSLAELAAPMLPPAARLSNLRWSSTYRISHRIVPHYAEGRVFLAGDAAHIHPPVGGQGMNTGLQDAYNLAWKLGLVSRGQAGEALLDSYSAERRPVGLDVVEQTSRAMDDSLAHRLRIPGMRETQLLIGYRNGALVQDDRAAPDSAAPAPGDRAPDADGLTRPFVGHSLRLRDRIGHGRHLLLGYDTDAETFASLARQLAAGLGRHATALRLQPSEIGASQEPVAALVDARGDVRENYAARPGMVWLLRPDGYIGWCSDQPDTAGLSRYLARLSIPG